MKKTLLGIVFFLWSIMWQKLDEGDDVDAHVNKMNELFQKLRGLGDEMKPNFFMSAILTGYLPESCDDLIKALKIRSKDELTSNLVRFKIKAEYKRRTDRNSGESDSNVLKVALSISSKDKMFLLQKNGYYKKECRKYTHGKTKRIKIKG